MWHPARAADMLSGKDGECMRHTTDQALDKGFIAGALGSPSSGNPFRGGQVAVAWLVGWTRGMKSRDDQKPDRGRR
jgi:ribosome modulation factor